MASLDPQWAGGRPRLISPGQPFTRWSVRKLADYLTHNRGGRRVRIGRERLRQLLHTHEITFQRTKTWKEATDPTLRSAAHLRRRRLQPPNHIAATRALHNYLRWRNPNARHPDVLAAHRRERARIRSERQQQWGQRATRAA